MASTDERMNTRTPTPDPATGERSGADSPGVSGPGGEAAPRAPWFLRDRGIGAFLVVTAVIGFVAAFDLSIEKVKKLENPEHVLSCDFNPFFSCGGVMNFPQSQIFGFPNQFIGVAAYVFPLLLGVLLLSRTRIPGWVMVGLNVGLAGGVALVMYLFVQSIFVIGIGCPWCMVVWTVTIPMFCLVTAYNLMTGNFGRTLAQTGAAQVIGRLWPLVAVVWLVVIGASVVLTFDTFFLTLLG